MFATLQHDIAQQIDSIKAQIEQLHHQQIALESHLQAIGTVEQACHSAIAQLQHALSGIRQVCPEQESEFWDTLNNLKVQATAHLTSNSQPFTETTTPPSPSPDGDEKWVEELPSIAIDVEATFTTIAELDEALSSPEPSITSAHDDLDFQPEQQSGLPSAEDLHTFLKPELRQRCRDQGLSDKGTKEVLIQRLEQAASSFLCQPLTS